jgi:hypothetical protein
VGALIRHRSLSVSVMKVPVKPAFDVANEVHGGVGDGGGYVVP